MFLVFRDESGLDFGFWAKISGLISCRTFRISIIEGFFHSREEEEAATVSSREAVKDEELECKTGSHELAIVVEIVEKETNN